MVGYIIHECRLYFEVSSEYGAGSPSSKTYFCHDVVERCLLEISNCSITFVVKGTRLI